MRLSEFEISNIKSLAALHFGPEVKVFLYGSRTDDQKKGGDIDLFISHPDDGALRIKTKIDFITDLIIQIGEQRIDVVLDNPEKRNSAFFKTIHKKAIQLC